MSYLVSWQTAYQVVVERDHGRLTTHPEVMDFSVEHGYRYLRILAGNEKPVRDLISSGLRRATADRSFKVEIRCSRGMRT